MKALSLFPLAILFLQAVPQSEPPVAQPEHLRYERTIAVPPGAGQACAALDAQIFPHAAPSLVDLRIFPSQYGSPSGASPSGAAHEIPYAITLSETVTEETEPARVLNLGAGAAKASGKIVFDLEMPGRAYTDVTLDLDGQDFLATATVSGSDSLGGRGKSTALGVFTLFDLSSQHLSRDTTLPLEESTFHYLHVGLSVSPAPGSGSSSVARFVPAMVQGAHVPPSREAETIYTTVAETASIATSGRESRAEFLIPPRVPVERVSFQLAPGFKGNFSRDIRVSALAEPPANPSTGQSGAPVAGSAAEDLGDEAARRAPLPEIVTGNILRVHATEAGREIHTEQLDIPAILGANLQRSAKVEVAIENGDDQPLPIAAVRLEMRQRKLCFDAAAVTSASSGATLFYGDRALLAPVYDYERLFVGSANPLAAVLGPERLNPGYHPPPAAVLPFTERHPQLLWIVLIAVIAALGVVALKSARNAGV